MPPLAMPYNQRRQKYTDSRGWVWVTQHQGALAVREQYFRLPYRRACFQEELTPQADATSPGAGGVGLRHDRNGDGEREVVTQEEA